MIMKFSGLTIPHHPEIDDERRVEWPFNGTVTVKWMERIWTAGKVFPEGYLCSESVSDRWHCFFYDQGFS